MQLLTFSYSLSAYQHLKILSLPSIHLNLKLPNKVLDLFGVDKDARKEHLWEVHVGIEQVESNRIQRRVTVLHEGDRVDESRSRSWRP